MTFTEIHRRLILFPTNVKAVTLNRLTHHSIISSQLGILPTLEAPL